MPFALLYVFIFSLGACMSTHVVEKEGKHKDAAVDDLARQRVELTSRIMALKAESAKIASQLVAAGRAVPACW